MLRLRALRPPVQHRPQRLHYVGIEAWPPAAADVLRSVAHLPALQPYAQALAQLLQELHALPAQTLAPAPG